MKIIYNPTFEQEVIDIVNYIALDKPIASINFALELEKLLLNIPNFPYKYKKSIYFDDENIRDMTYKGYTITYKINLDKNTIEIMKIFNKNKPL